jgi:tetratricopeptide (TPR) repeat protein
MNRHQRRANSRLRGTSNAPGAEASTGGVVLDAAELLRVGRQHHQAGRLSEAEGCYRRILAAQPDHADALHLLGLLAQQARRHDLAVQLFRQAIAQNGRIADYFLSLSGSLILQAKFEDAARACRQAIVIKPDVAEAHANLALALKALGKLDEAVTACRQAIAIKPDIAEAHSNLGLALSDQGKFDEAIAAYREAIRINPDYAEAHSNLGLALRSQGKFEEALAAYRQAIAIKPVIAGAHANLGEALVKYGRLSEARSALEQAVRLAPRNTTFLYNLANVRRFVAGDPHLAAMEQLARESASLSFGERIYLHFALGKAYEDLGRHADAFRQWLDGNALKRRQIAYDEAKTLGDLDRVRAVFTPELISTRENLGNPSAVPVFIVGMMRSGSTLVEQILASHPKVFGGGELEHFSRAVQAIRTAPGGSATFPESVPGMTGEDYRDLGTRYLAEIERLAPGAARITDKMPKNFMVAGLIHLALPNAAIIHTVRDPVDTCLSSFSKFFTDEQNHTYNLAELGRYYRHYQALMAHWRRVLPPGRILDVRYEDVVADLEGQARRILAHCGLDWDERCLSFHKTVRPVLTWSTTQVRQPIYTTAVGRWRVYEEFLAPLLAELDVAVAEASTGSVALGAAELLQVGRQHHQAGHLAEAEGCYRLGASLFLQGKFEEAAAAYRQATAIKPDYAEAHTNLGLALKRQGKFEEAVAACRQAITVNAESAAAHYNLGVALFDQGRLDEAIAAYCEAIRINPDYAEAHSNLGLALRSQGKFEEAFAAYRQAIAIKPVISGTHANLGEALVKYGHLAEGRAALEQAVRLAPRNTKFLYNLANVTRFAAGDPHLAAMEQLARESASLSFDERIYLHFALGKAYEDLGRHADAFRQWLDANALKRRQIAYDEAKTLGDLDRVRAVFTPELISTRKNLGNPSAVPVFIVGMMRSGSTLVEQILASHPKVFGGGELEHFHKAMQTIRTAPGGSATFPESVPGMTGEDYRDLGTRYLAEIERLAPGAARITDKMPGNFIYAGLIHLALPNAAIIHTVRDPVDTCLSSFSKLFTVEQNHTYDLAELGRHYRQYQALMAHWHRVLPPGRILDVRYEDVVADLEGQARRILAHCGLDWDERCLSFHKTVRPVLTSSTTQVRQPIYTSAVGRWRAYEEFLAPLLAVLDLMGTGG